MRKINSILFHCATGLALVQPLQASVTFSITPAAVSNTYNGPVTLQIGGVANGETVVVQKFLDLNANGIIDAGDLLVQQFSLTDGQGGMVIGGVTNFNVPGDLNSTPGNITAALNFRNWDSLQNIVGNYLYKLSSPIGDFTPLTNQFAVTNFLFPQAIVGNVVSNAGGGTVPNAIVLLFPNGEGPPLAGTVANSSGGYALAMPPGAYVPWALSSNYVFNSSTAPLLMLAAGQTLTTNLPLINATASISGHVVDSANTGLGLPGIFQPGMSSNGLVAFGFSDTNGNFNLPVTAGEWALGTVDWGLVVHGYVGWKSSANFVAAAGASGLILDYPKATALFYGSVTDNLGNPAPGINVRAYDNNDLYQIDGYTGSNGDYVVAVLGNPNDEPWQVEVKTETSSTNYVYSEQTVSGSINANQAVPQNFTAIAAPNRITGWVKDNSGVPIANVTIVAYATINGLSYNSSYGAQTDANGNYSLNVANGTWSVGIDGALSDNYITPADQTVVIANNNAVADFTATLVALPYTFTTGNGTITITSYNGPGGAVTIPDQINNLPVTSIGTNAFYGNAGLTSVTIPNSVTNIGDDAFAACPSLANVYVQGNAPAGDSTMFASDNKATVYYLPGETGWSSTFGGVPTAVWIPFSYTTNADNTLTITGYTGLGGAVTIPASINGLTVAVVGNGAVAVFSTSVAGVTIPNSVTSIGALAFASCFNLTDVLMGDNITNIGALAFNACINLTSIAIPASVTMIGSRAFASCSGLTAITVDANNLFYSSINGVLFNKSQTTLIELPGGLADYTIPTGVASLGAYAFSDDNNLTSITIPNSVTNIGNDAFFACSYLASIYFQGNAPTLGSTVFGSDNDPTVYYLPGSSGWSSTFGGIPTAVWVPFPYTTNPDNTLTITGYNGSSGAVVIPSSINGLTVTGIGDYAFYNGFILSSVTIPNSIAIIGNDAFYDCVNLISVTIGNTVSSIGQNAFGDSGLTSITIPGSVTNIGDYAFQNCASLTAITVDAANSFYSSADGVLFDKGQTTLLEYPGGLGGSYTVPTGVASISIDAFYGCADLTSVTIPNTVTNIGDAAFFGCTALGSVAIGNGVSGIGQQVFGDCGNLTAITVDPANSIYSSLDGVLFDKEQTMLIGYPGGRNGSYAVPGSVINIEDNAFFECYGLTAVTIPNNVTNIGGQAFASCYNLTNVTIGNSVTSIGPAAFYETGLATVTIPASVTNFGVEAIGEGGTSEEAPFAECSSLTAISVSPNNPVYSSIGGIMFNKSLTTLVEYPDGLSGSYTIPATVTSLGFEAFSLSSLSNVTIPDSVTNIESSAFWNCIDLMSVTLPSSITTLGDFAFYACFNLTSIYFNGGAPIAGSSAFADDEPTIYYLRGTTGWHSTFDGVRTVELTAIPITANLTNGVVPFTVSFTSAAVDGLGQAVTNRTWDFGDGSTSAAQNLSHTYTSAGAFSASLIETDANGLPVAGEGVSIKVSSPTVAFTATPTNGVVPMTVSFTSPAVDSVGNTIANWNWNFGDGSTSGARNPSHTYTNTGVFSTALFATNSLGYTVVGTGPPSITAAVYSGLVLNGGFGTGDFTGWSFSGDAPSIFVDDGSRTGISPYSGNYEAALGTYGPLGYLAQTLATTAGARYLISFWVDNPYADPGEFLVSWNGITIFDTTNLVATNWINLQFVVLAPGPGTVLQFGFGDAYDDFTLDDISVVPATNFLEFAATPTVGQVPFTVQFTSPTADNQGNAITHWSWNFGDGSTSAVQSPSHLYANSGTFFPSLIATNILGGTVLGSGPPSIQVNPLVLNGDFETGDFTNWSLSGNTSNTFVDDGSLTGISPFSGNYEAALGTFGSPGYLSQTLATVSGTRYLLSFWFENPDEDLGEFMVSWNGSTILDTTNLVADNWTNMQFVVLATDSGSVLQFGFEDDYDNLALDDISAAVVSNFVQFSATPTLGQVPLTVSFASPATDNDGNALSSWFWNFGDGSTSAVRSPSHVYAGAGAYFPSLVASNSLGRMVPGSGPASITATNLVLNEDFENGDFTGWTLSGDTINCFVDDGSITGITPYSGNYESALGTSGATGYLSQTLDTTAGTRYLLSFWFDNPDQDPGEFMVSWNGVTILDTTNLAADDWTNMQFVVLATDTSSVLQFGFQDDYDSLGLDDISVEGATNFLPFAATPTAGQASLTVQFTSSAVDHEGNTITAWLWNFGDGSTSTAQNPLHFYANGGTFFPTLIATNHLGGLVLGSGPASITVTSLVLNGGFETGDFTGWTLSGDTNNTFVDDGSQTGISPEAGNYAAVLGGTSTPLGELSQTLATTAGASYLLSFWFNNPNADPGRLVVSWGGKTLLSATHPTANDWTRMQYVVSATGPSTVLQFGYEDDIDNFLLDDIEVAQAQPGIASFSVSGANLVLSGFNGHAGLPYYLLTSTNLTLPLSQWTRIATNVLNASGNFTITATNTVTHNIPQRLYMLELQ